MPNFSLLQAIEPPKAIASLPAVTQPNGTDQFVGGMLSGAAQAQQLAAGAMDLHDKKRASAYADKLDAAAQQNRDAYMAALRPDDRIKVLTMEAQQREAEAKAREEGAQAAYAVATYNGIAHSSALHFTNPEGQQKAYQDIYNKAPKDVQELMPKTFDPTYAPIAVNNGLSAEAAFLRSKHGAATSADNSGLGKTILTSPEARTAFFKDEDLNQALINGMRTGHQILTQMNSMPENALNPVTGDFNAKYTAQGQALNKNINQLITQAPSMLGIPATALRSATVWQMVKDSKPRPGMWMVAAKAVTENLLYEGALQQHQTWQSMAEKMQAQAATGVPAAVNEAKTWLANHPDPLLEHPKPDLTNFYKLFPKAKDIGMEDELNAAQGKSASSQPGQQGSQMKTYQLNGKPFDIEAAKKATGLSEEEIVKQAGLQ